MSTIATPGLIEDFIELSEGLSESSDMCAVVFPREKKEEILPFIIEEGSGRAQKACSQTISHRIEPHYQCPGHLQPTSSSTLS